MVIDTEHDTEQVNASSSKPEQEPETENEISYRITQRKVNSFVKLFDDNNVIHRNLAGAGAGRAIVPGMYQLALIVEQDGFPDYSYIDVKFSDKLSIREIVRIRKTTGRYDYELINSNGDATTQLKIGHARSSIDDVLKFEAMEGIKKYSRAINMTEIQAYYDSIGMKKPSHTSHVSYASNVHVAPKIMPAMYVPAVLLGYGTGKGYLLGLKLDIFSDPELGKIEVYSAIKHGRGRNYHIKLEITQRGKILAFGESSILEID